MYTHIYNIYTYIYIYTSAHLDCTLCAGTSCRFHDETTRTDLCPEIRRYLVRGLLLEISCWFTDSYGIQGISSFLADPLSDSLLSCSASWVPFN